MREFCDDIKSYKTLIPTLNIFEGKVIITVDDDIYYSDNMLEEMYKSYLQNPDNIYAPVKKKTSLGFIV